MYIIAIAWIYVALMAAVAEPNITAGVITFLFWGLLPLSLVLYILGGPTRRRRRAFLEQAEAAAEANADAPEPPQPKN